MILAEKIETNTDSLSSYSIPLSVLGMQYYVNTNTNTSTLKYYPAISSFFALHLFTAVKMIWQFVWIYLWETLLHVFMRRGTSCLVNYIWASGDTVSCMAFSHIKLHLIRRFHGKANSDLNVLTNKKSSFLLRRRLLSQLTLCAEPIVLGINLSCFLSSRSVVCGWETLVQ